MDNLRPERPGWLKDRVSRVGPAGGDNLQFSPGNGEFSFNLDYEPKDKDSKRTMEMKRFAVQAMRDAVIGLSMNSLKQADEDCELCPQSSMWSEIATELNNQVLKLNQKIKDKELEQVGKL